jgi:galactokinase
MSAARPPRRRSLPLGGTGAQRRRGLSSTLHDTVTTGFERAFGCAPAVVYRAPGRVNLIGEHTDYNDGYVLPCAIDFHTLVAAAPRADGQVRVVALDHGAATDTFPVARELERRSDADWPNYVRGVVRALARLGLAPGGADLAIAGDVPQGAGLSSSASLELALLGALQALNPALAGLDGARLARLGQQAENEFVGCNCGIMDQLIAALGVAGHALLVDCRTLATEPVPLPDGVAVLIAHSRVRRGLVDSAYNERRAQCQAAAQHFGVAALRDVDETMLGAAEGRLDPLVLRRARHIVTENRRVLAARAALAAGDLAALGAEMAASHTSMARDFEITVPAIDRLVEVLQQAIGREGGARMTGGGFGGCAVALLPHERVPAVRAALEAGYRSPEGLPATVYLCRATAGMGPLV